MGVMSERHSQLQEHTNEYGYPETYLVDEDGSKTVVCSQCTCRVMPNRGQGMICDTCRESGGLKLDGRLLRR